MIGNELSVIEAEAFTCIYTLAVLRQLILDGCLVYHTVPILQSLAYETMFSLATIYPLPTYRELAEQAYKLLERESDKPLTFTVDDLEALCIHHQVNNGYIELS